MSLFGLEVKRIMRCRIATTFSSSAAIMMYLLLNVTVSNADVLPQNTAATTETSLTYLNCTYAGQPYTAISWSFSPANGSPSTLIVSGCGASSAQSNYTTDFSAAGNCNLLIHNVIPALAGLYTCQTLAPSSASAQFIVLDSDATCTIQEDSGQNQANILCGISYTGNLQPVPAWFNPSDIDAPVISYNSSYVYSSATVNIADVTQYNCAVSFDAVPSQPAGYATNAPAFTSTCHAPAPNATANGTNSSGWIGGFNTKISLTGSLVIVNVYYCGNCWRLL